MSTDFSNFNTRDKTFPSVVITGVEAYSSLGNDIDTTWKNLLAKKSGISLLEDDFVEEFNLPVKIGGKIKFDPSSELEVKERRRYSFSEQISLLLIRKLWNKIGSPDVDPERLAVSYGSSAGDSQAIANTVLKLHNEGYRKISPFAVQMSMPNGPAAVVGLEIGAKAGVLTPVSACSTGAESIAQAWRTIVFGDADMVITGGVESRIDPVPIAAFSMMRALSTRNDDPQAASRPFDKDRDGFVFGEAAAMLVMETEEHAKARGAKILARIMGAGIASDGFHIVAPHPEGEGAARAITRALKTAGVAPEEISLVNAHATSTSVGDIAECKAIHKAIGKNVAVYAPKSALGHSIGSVGALESILTILSVHEGIVPPTLNLDNLDPEIDLDVVHGEPRKGDFEYAIKSSFAFGGHNVALVFGKY